MVKTNSPFHTLNSSQSAHLRRTNRRGRLSSPFMPPQQPLESLLAPSRPALRTSRQQTAQAHSRLQGICSQHDHLMVCVAFSCVRLTTADNFTTSTKCFLGINGGFAALDLATFPTTLGRTISGGIQLLPSLGCRRWPFHGSSCNTARCRARGQEVLDQAERPPDSLAASAFLRSRKTSNEAWEAAEGGQGTRNFHREPR